VRVGGASRGRKRDGWEGITRGGYIGAPVKYERNERGGKKSLSGAPREVFQTNACIGGAPDK
jgi:hypothetical protein